VPVNVKVPLEFTLLQAGVRLKYELDMYFSV